jgi:hypothetical protein
VKKNLRWKGSKSTSNFHHHNINGPGAIVLQLLDNSYYYTKGPDGSRTLPTREPDGRYHVKGDLVLCASETQADHLQALKPILDAAVFDCVTSA